jgi:TetR/AcrR family transcriptional regulator, ethionamide resistance regulator
MPVMEDLLAETTFSDLGVDDLIRQGGISRSRFYVHFEDKGDLLAALAADTVTELIDHTLQWWSLPPGATLKDLVKITDGLVKTYLAHRHLLAAVVQVSTYDARVREVFSTMYEDALVRYADTLAEQQATGLVDPRLDAQRTVLLLSRMTEEGFYHLIGTGSGRDIKRLAGALTVIIWKTVYARARES